MSESRVSNHSAEGEVDRVIFEGENTERRTIFGKGPAWETSVTCQPVDLSLASKDRGLVVIVHDRDGGEVGQREGEGRCCYLLKKFQQFFR